MYLCIKKFGISIKNVVMIRASILGNIISLIKKVMHTRLINREMIATKI